MPPRTAIQNFSRKWADRQNRAMTPLFSPQDSSFEEHKRKQTRHKKTRMKQVYCLVFWDEAGSCCWEVSCIWCQSRDCCAGIHNTFGNLHSRRFCAPQCSGSQGPDLMSKRKSIWGRHRKEKMAADSIPLRCWDYTDSALYASWGMEWEGEHDQMSISNDQWAMKE